MITKRPIGAETRYYLMLRFDTQFGTQGTLNPAAFTNQAAYSFIDPTKLGTGCALTPIGEEPRIE